MRRPPLVKTTAEKKETEILELELPAEVEVPSLQGI